MKLFITIAFLLALSAALPQVEQMLLANSMVVGREDQLDLVNWECNVCDTTNRPLHAHYIQEKQKDVKCILAVYPTFVSLAFRYTNTVQNVWQDLVYADQVVDTRICSNCKVQKAYKKMWDTIRDDVIRDLAQIKAQTGQTRIYITGISLGGGLAVLAFIDVKSSNIFTNVDVITFGAPRVVNTNYADQYELLTTRKTKRYIVKGDPIVVLPECLTLLCNYKHVGSQYVCIEDAGTCTGCMSGPSTFLGRLDWKYNRDPSQQNLDGILDHIYGYKKIYNHTVIEC